MSPPAAHWVPADDEEEQLALALALSASMADAPAKGPGPTSSGHTTQRGNAARPMQAPLANSEPYRPTPPQASPAPAGVLYPHIPPVQPYSHSHLPPAPPPARPSARPVAPAPTPAPRAHPPAGAATAAPLPSPQRQPLHSDPNACAGCGRGFFLQSYTKALGRKWHAECFRCGFCNEPVTQGSGGGQFMHTASDPKPYHPDCFRHVHAVACHVCGGYIQPGPDGTVQFKETGFWRERYCQHHRDEEVVRCCGCSRARQHGQEWAVLADGRQLCLPCVSSVVVDTPDAQPLYDQVRSFFREMQLPHPERPPLLMVDGRTLSEFSNREGRADGEAGPVFHVRGLCVAQVYTSIPSIQRTLGLGVRSVSSALPPPTGSVRCSVTVLLVLYGLPRLLAGSIMAHELMHAWLRMAGVVNLNLKVEEGLCQLMAYLWVDKQHELLKQDPEQQRLASYCTYQIRNDTSDVYGNGFRDAFDAFQRLGLSRLVLNVATKGSFY